MLKVGAWIIMLGASAAAWAGRPTGDTDVDPDARALRRQLIRQVRKDAWSVPTPQNNPTSPEKVRLGEALFFDPNLSGCGQVACATCHSPEKGLGDGLTVSVGCDGKTGRRNSNGFYQGAFQSHQFWDGRVQTLEEQALGPVVDPVEMANTWDDVLRYLRTGVHPRTKAELPAARAWYAAAFEKAFGGEISTTTVSRALAAYERTALSRASPFDRWLQGDDRALEPSQKKGLLVFFGRGGCSECHRLPHFTDSDFHNLGLPLAGHERAEHFPLNPKLCGGLPPLADPGRAGVELLHSSCEDVGKFKTPTLRNVALSGPYMHNGCFPTLEAVVRHYIEVAEGKAKPLAGSLASDALPPRARLGEAGGEADDVVTLVEFMKALTGTQLESPPGGVAPPK